MQKRIAKSRGRPRGRYFASADFRRLEYIALVSTKYGIDSEKLLNRFVKAWKHQKSKCKTLLIECRMKTRDSAIFLVTQSFEVVAQFSIPKRILEDTSQFIEAVRSIASKRKTQETDQPQPVRIQELKVGMKRINLKAKVVRIPKPRSVFTRFGSSAIVTNASITDETGVIQLTLWNEQIDLVSVGDLICIKNARVETFRGERQLKLSRSGQLDVIEKTETCL